MKTAGFIVLLFLVTLIAACEKTEHVSSGCIAAGDSIVVRLQYGQEKSFCSNDSSCFRFNRLVTESRCPSDVICVWSGTAVIELTTCDSEGGTLNLEIYKPSIYTLNGQQYSIELTALTPYPSTAHPAKVEDYIATITLKREG